MASSSDIAQKIAAAQEHLDGLKRRLAEIRDQIEACRRDGDPGAWLHLTYERDRLVDTTIPTVEAAIAERRAEWREARRAELDEEIAPLQERLDEISHELSEISRQAGYVWKPEERDRHDELQDEREQLTEQRRQLMAERAPLVDGLEPVNTRPADPDYVRLPAGVADVRSERTWSATPNDDRKWGTDREPTIISPWDTRR